MTLKLKEWGGIAILFAVLSFLFFENTAGIDSLLAGGDNLFFFTPIRQLWIDAVGNFTFPLWNPHALTGLPLFATIQPAVLYPPSLLYLVLPFYFVFNATVILHFALAGTGMYVLSRKMETGKAAALASALVFMLCGFTFSLYRYQSTLLPVAWIPLLLLAFFGGILLNRTRYTLAASAIAAMMFCAGGVETCYQVFPWMFLIALFPKTVFDKPAPEIKIRLLHMILFGLAFLGLSAIQLFPAMELSALSTRRHGLENWEAVLWSLKPGDFLMFFMLDPFGYFMDRENLWVNQNWVQTLYMGAIPFLLCGFFFLKDRRRRIMFLIVILASVLLALGSNTFLYPLFRESLPLFGSFRYLVKFVLPGVFIIALCAGLGFDRFVKNVQTNPDYPVGRGFLITGSAFILLFGSVYFVNDPWLRAIAGMGGSDPVFSHPEIFLGNLMRMSAFASVFCLLLFFHWRVRRFKAFFLSGAVIVLGMDLFFASHGLSFKKDLAEYKKESLNFKFIQSDPDLFRIYIPPETKKGFTRSKIVDGTITLDAYLAMVHPMMGAPKGISYVGGVAVMRPHYYYKLYQWTKKLPFEKRTPLLSLINAKYILSVTPWKLDSVELVHMDPGGDPMAMSEETRDRMEMSEAIKIYRNKNVLPRAFLAEGCRIVKSEEDYPKAFSSPEFDLSAVLLLEEEPQGFSCGQRIPSGSRERAEVVAYGMNELEISVEAESKRLLFVSDAWFPGWKAEVDGRPVGIHRADYAFRAVALEPGNHRVRFFYDPLSFKLGLAVSSAAFIACLWMAFRKRAF